MNDLFALSQLIKNHPLYQVRRDEIHHLYRTLAQKKDLHAGAVMVGVKELWRDLHEELQKSHAQFKLLCAESLRLRLDGVQMLCYGEENYPAGCYWMSDPPLTLTLRGDPAWRSQKCIAVVGSREPVFESVQWMEREFLSFCEASRPCVISGGARGVDQKAHAIALRAKQPTVAVLPSGLGNVYPENLKEWGSAILDQGGALLSEYAFEQRMHKWLFHHRNRLIAALGGATLLVEARRRSGTLITAQQSIHLGRPVWVVPGHPLDPHFGGSLDLLSEGALMIRDAEDLNMSFAAELLHGKEDLVGTTLGIAVAQNPIHYL